MFLLPPSYLPPSFPLSLFPPPRTRTRTRTRTRLGERQFVGRSCRAAKSAALNIAEAAGRVSHADRARVFAIARGEAMEAAAGVEIAVLAGDADGDAFEACLAIAERLVALLTGLCR